MTSRYALSKSRAPSQPDPPPEITRVASTTFATDGKALSDSTLGSAPTFHVDGSVLLDDYELEAISIETKLRIDWGNVLLSARVGPARWQRQNVVASDCTVFTRQESSRFDVLSVGLVPGCVAEILNVLQSHSSEQYAQQMEGIYGSQFRSGEILYRVDVDTRKASASVDAPLAELTVKRLSFTKPSWFANHEEWCYTDAVYRSARGGRHTIVEKLMTTMQSKDIALVEPGATSGNAFHDVICGYLLRAGADDPPRATQGNQLDDYDHDDHDHEDLGDDDSSQRLPRETRVSFYAEFQVPKQIAKGWRRSTAASDKTIKQRLLGLAESTARLTTLVRRQRLGLQVLADAVRFLPPTNVPCRVCTRMLLIAKLCRVCGHGVCGDCSGKHERARLPRRGRRHDVTRVRVCAFCLERIDQAEYGNLTSSSLLGAHVKPDPTAMTLRELLQDALLSAPSPDRKASVKSVIKCVLDHEAAILRDRSGSSTSSHSSPSLTPTSSDVDYVQALDALAVDDVVLRSDDHRVYQLDTSGTATAVPTPVPDNEEERLKAVWTMNVPALATVVELEILCELAAREMGCDTSVIALIDRDQYIGVASNVPELRGALVPRTQAMCAHTIMESQAPLLVVHPEMDIRFSKFESVDQYGVRFYCAFPLISEDGYVVGSMCCVNGESIDVSESQLVAFQRLAATASKVMRIETELRRRKDSFTSSNPAAHP